jgi:hypothetical protein
MTREELIRLAVEAKLVCHWDGGCASAWVEGHDLTPYLERFAALVAAAEREACASIIDDAIGATVVAKAEVDPESGEHIYDQDALEIVLSALSANAAAIRSRT